jgi:hypothetical protein
MTGGDDVMTYAAQVRAALSDLPDEQLAELLEDLDQHLAEVAAEEGVSLVARLGPAEEYAAELRRTALLAPPAPGAGRRGGFLLRSLRADLDRLAQVPGMQEARDFLPELRPAWWVLRAALVLVALNALAGGSGLIPLGPVLGLPLLAAAVVLSVRLGRREADAPPNGHVRRLTLGVNTGLGVLALALFFGVGLSRDSEPVYADHFSPYGDGRTTLVHEDGTPITNLFPYSPDGQPLSGVLLYDQDGRPVDNLTTTTVDGEQIQPVVVPGTAPRPGNAYPQEQQVMTYDDMGRPVPVPVGPAPVPGPTPSPTLGPAPAPSPEPSPAATAAPSPAPS